MNRQEPFHGELYLDSVRRADRGYRGASILYCPYFMLFPAIAVTGDMYSLN